MLLVAVIIATLLCNVLGVSLTLSVTGIRQWAKLLRLTVISAIDGME